jgi:hypothetical protein
MMKKMKWKTKLGGPDSPVKRKILGENSARLYKVPIKTALERMTTDQIALMKQQYLAEGIERNNAYYGYVPKPALTRAHPGDATPSV